MARPEVCQGTELLVAGLLVHAGSPLPFGDLPHWIEYGWRNAKAPHPSAR